MKTSAHILGIGDLLNHVRGSLNPEQRINAADNALLPVVEGIKAIGDLMSTIDRSRDLEQRTLADMGYLLSFLAELTSSLQQVKNAAEYEDRHGRPMEMVA